MVLLAIDTAGPDCSVAVASGGAEARLVARDTERVGRGHADILMPMIARVMEAAGCHYPDLERLAVTVGPGSFTGIRAGIATARGLALALDIPAVGVDVLQAMLDQADGAASPVVAALDARRGEIFAAAREGATDDVTYPSVAGTPDAIAQDLRALFASAPVSLIGSGADLLATALGELGVATTIIDRTESADIAAVATRGARLPVGRPPAPLYLRGADAKVQTGKAVARR